VLAEEDHAGLGSGPVEVGPGEAGTLRRIGRPDDDHDDLGPGVTQSPRRLEELGEPLLPNQATHDAGDHLVGSYAEGPACGLCLARPGPETHEIDAVAEQVQLASGHVQTLQDGDVLDVLDEFGL